VLSFTGAGAGLAAVAEGFELIKRAATPVVVVGAVDVIDGLAAGSAQGKPFDESRSGARPAETACVMVLEDGEVATAREARVYAEVLGGGMAFSRATVMKPAANHVDAARALRAALMRAEVFQGEIDAVFASAFGDPDEDAIEGRALRDFWGPNVDRLTVTSVHGATGRAAASSGLLSLVAAIKALSEGIVPPATGCERPAQEFSALDIVTGTPRQWSFNTAIVNDFSAGNNAALVVRKSG
jgi:3-oxoacyl-(acyl-carrier-protein) synthase